MCWWISVTTLPKSEPLSTAWVNRSSSHALSSYSWCFVYCFFFFLSSFFLQLLDNRKFLLIFEITFEFSFLNFLPSSLLTYYSKLLDYFILFFKYALHFFYRLIIFLLWIVSISSLHCEPLKWKSQASAVPGIRERIKNVKKFYTEYFNYLRQGNKSTKSDNL